MTPATPTKIADKTKDTTPQADPWMGSWRALKQSAKYIVRNPLLPLSYAALYAASYVADNHFEAENNTELLLSYLLTFLPVIVFATALPGYGLAAADRRKSAFGEFWRYGARRFFYALVASALVFVIMFGSFILFVLPLIWTAAWFAYALYPVVESGTGPRAALKESMRLGTNHKWKFWSMFLLYILAFILLYTINEFIPVADKFIDAYDVVLASIEAFLAVILTCGLAVLYRWLQRNAPASAKQ